MKPIQYFSRVGDFIRSDPARVPNMVKREFCHTAQRLNQQYHQRFNHLDGYDLMAADWDTAIILDACRYDIFAQRQGLQQGTLEKRTAPGGESREFMQRSFQGRQLHDTVYVTGNPYTTILGSNTFHDLYMDENWNDAGTEVPPDRLTDTAIRAHESHPNKRIVVHYMQPHLPILHPDHRHVNDSIEYHRTGYILDGVSRTELREAYTANLEYVLEYVEELLTHIEGKVVVTADHGELLGDRQSPIPIRGTDHHPELYVPELVDIPWLTISAGPRRETKADPPQGDLQVDEEIKKDRLEALGYV